MGTSGPYPGPGKHSPLLPPWADDGSPEPFPSPFPQPHPEMPNPLPDGDKYPDQGTPPPNPDVPAPSPYTDIPNAPNQPNQGGNYWPNTSKQFTKYAQGGGSASLGKALKSYTRSKGGSRRAARAARAGRLSTTKLGGFLSNTAARGIIAASEALGLSDTILGMPVELALASILDAIVPDGSTLDESAARQAINATLEEIYKRYQLEDGNISKLETIDTKTAGELVGFSVVSYISERILQDLGTSFESGKISLDEVIKLEREVFPYIRETVKLEMVLQDINVLTINWAGPEGQQFTENIYTQAYALLEAKS
jgi:hypothetical protein